MRQSETAADKTAISKKTFDLTGSGVCCDIEVFGCAFQEQVANTPAHQISSEAVVAEPVKRPKNIRG